MYTYMYVYIYIYALELAATVEDITVLHMNNHARHTRHTHSRHARFLCKPVSAMAAIAWDCFKGTMNPMMGMMNPMMTRT